MKSRITYLLCLETNSFVLKGIHFMFAKGIAIVPVTRSHISNSLLSYVPTSPNQMACFFLMDASN